MGNSLWRDYLRNPREFDRWLTANAILSSFLAVAMLAMALAGLYSAGPPNGFATASTLIARSKLNNPRGERISGVNLCWRQARPSVFPTR
jgi:hypothetical protein